MPAKKGNRVQIAAYLDESTYAAVQKLSENTRIPVAVFMREAVDDLLSKYKVKVPKAKRG